MWGGSCSVVSPTFFWDAHIGKNSPSSESLCCKIKYFSCPNEPKTGYRHANFTTETHYVHTQTHPHTHSHPCLPSTMLPGLRKTLSSHHWQCSSCRSLLADSSAWVGPRSTRTTTSTKCSSATASSTSMPLLQRAAALPQTHTGTQHCQVFMSTCTTAGIEYTCYYIHRGSVSFQIL